MTPAGRIRDLIMSPLQRCYPAEMPKKRLHKPAGLNRIVWKTRQKQHELAAGLR